MPPRIDRFKHPGEALRRLLYACTSLDSQLSGMKARVGGLVLSRLSGPPPDSVCLTDPVT